MEVIELGLPSVEIFLLVLARTAGIFTLVPIFGSNQIPVQARLAVALALATVFTPMVIGTTDVTILNVVDVAGVAFLVAKETVVGLAIGFVTMLVFAAIQAAGDFIDLQAGFSFAATVDPTYGAQTAIVGRFHQLLAGLLFFVTNAHHVVLIGLGQSFQIVPLGKLAVSGPALPVVLKLFESLFAVSIKIAAPVVAAVFLADVALAVLARIVPQMNILMVGLPLKLGVGLVGTAIAVPVAISVGGEALTGVNQATFTLLDIIAGN